MVWGDRRRFCKDHQNTCKRSRISPLVNTDRKWWAFPIMLQQFKRAIGVAIVRGNSNLKLARLHCARSTSEEAVATCRADQRNNKWRPGQNSTVSWFMEHVPEGYGTFEQFRNWHGFCVHYMHTETNQQQVWIKLKVQKEYTQKHWIINMPLIPKAGVI